MDIPAQDRPFPLKRYYLIYGGIGAVIFYTILFALFISAERQALYEEYLHGVSEKARNLYLDIQRDFLEPHGLTVEAILSADTATRQAFRDEIEQIIAADFQLTRLKLFRADSTTLYDHDQPEREGQRFLPEAEPGFQVALSGQVDSEIVVEADGHRLMEAYLPIHHGNSDDVVAVLEIYEDVSRFEHQVQRALKKALFLPTLVFIIFKLVLYLIVAKADGVITHQTERLMAIRQNMAKYLSPSAVQAIDQAVSQQTELFRGERQEVVIFFSDIRGFTAYSEVTEPEVVVQTLNTHFQIQARIIHRHGGVIDKFVGDELMVLFPAGHESAAVHAAMEILQTLQADPSVTLSIGIGIHTGEAVVGSIGTLERRDFTAIGDTVNTGARLCASCPGDSATISSAVFKRLPAALRYLFSAREQLELKGKAAATGVYRLAPERIHRSSGDSTLESHNSAKQTLLHGEFSTLPYSGLEPLMDTPHS